MRAQICQLHPARFQRPNNRPHSHECDLDPALERTHLSTPPRGTHFTTVRSAQTASLACLYGRSNSRRSLCLEPAGIYTLCLRSRLSARNGRNVQAANRREEERQAGSQTSETAGGREAVKDVRSVSQRDRQEGETLADGQVRKAVQSDHLKAKQRLLKANCDVRGSGRPLATFSRTRSRSYTS